MMFTILVFAATESASGNQKRPAAAKRPSPPTRKHTRPSKGPPAKPPQQQQKPVSSSQTKPAPSVPAQQSNPNSKPANAGNMQPAVPTAGGAPETPPAATGRGLKSPTPSGTSSPSGPPAYPGGGPPSTPAFQPVDHGNGVVQTAPNRYLNVNNGRAFTRDPNNPNPVQYLGRNRQGQPVWFDYSTNQFTAPPPQASGSAGAGSSSAAGAGSSSAAAAQGQPGNPMGLNVVADPATLQGEDRPNSNTRLIEHVKNMIARGYTMGPDGQWRGGGRDGSELRRFD
ncbi:hypothetical protein MIR68_003292 [Amoeboaphelidium protococcarum]|nr:hypothetical protein MIR68_003292 [Amoeboaphelidium protococcarum]